MLNNNLFKKINPLIKVICILIFLIFIWLFNDRFLLIYLLSLTFGLFLFSNLKLKNIVNFLWPIRYLIILIIFSLYYFKGLDSRIICIKIIFSLIYWCLFYTSFTKYYLTLGLLKILNFFNIFDLDLKRCFKNIYFIFCGFSYIKLVVKDFLFVNCLRGVDTCYITDLEKNRILFKNKKIIYESYKKMLNDAKEEYNYHYQSNSKLTVSFNIKRYDYLYFLLHLFIIFIYVWRIRV